MARNSCCVTVVMPAYRAAQTLREVYERIPRAQIHEVILVDDGSLDATFEVAQSLDVVVVRHPENVGYGASQKSGYQLALRRGADVIVMLHPDGQYDPAQLPALVDPIRTDRAEIVLGSRMPTMRAWKMGMPLWRLLSNRLLTWVENLLLDQQIADYHTGYRAYSRRFLSTVPFHQLSNDFSFDSELLIHAIAKGVRIIEVPVTVRYGRPHSSIRPLEALIYAGKTIRLVLRHRLDQRQSLAPSS